MTVTARMRGHRVYHDGQVWRHADDHTLAPASGGQERPCTHCGLTAEDGYGPDPCLGWIDGVDGACCGHGVEERRPRHPFAVSLALVVAAAALLVVLIVWGVL